MTRILFFTALILTVSVAPLDGGNKEKIKKIKKMYANVEKNLSTYAKSKVTYTNPDPDKYWDISSYTSYNKGNTLVKLVETKGEEMYLLKTSYYFNKGKLFFIFEEGFFDDIKYSESRYYVNNDKVIKALDKQREKMKESPAMSKIKNKQHPEFKKNKKNATQAVMKDYKEAVRRYGAAN